MEDLNFYLDSTHFTVKGDYYFSNGNSKEVKQIIFYPFPQKDVFGIIDSVSVFDNITNKELPVSISKNSSGISFPLSIEGYGFIKLKIIYRQELKAHYAEYILTTTKNWGKPLETANYKLFVSNKIKMDSLSYAADNVKSVNGSKVYYWSKKNFFPKENFEFIFHH